MFMYFILWQGPQAALVYFVDIFYSKFQISSTCSVSSEFCAEIGYFAPTWAANEVNVRDIRHKRFKYLDIG